MKLAFYPGCSLEGSATAYADSVRAVCEGVGIDLVELKDWNCCGATEYWSQDKLTAQAVIARNLALVEPELNQLTAPCAACHLNLVKVDLAMAELPAVNDQVNRALAAGRLHYEPGRVKVRHLLEILCEDIGEEVVRKQVVQPLHGVRVAPYHGCQIVRPYDDFDDPEYPMYMDHLLTWCGAEVVDYPVKSHCCGGHMTQISDAQAFELIRRLLHSAAEYEANVVACACPMCQLNLDAYQGRTNNYFNTNFRIPVLFFTQLVGLAFGRDPSELGFGKEIVSAQSLIDTWSLATQGAGGAR